MKVSEVKQLLDLAYKARKNGDVFNPLFVSAPGLGKSSIVQQWAKENNLPLIDLRAAYLEAPEIIGYPIVTTVDGKQKMHHALPDFWPESGSGVLFLDEPNRGSTTVLNTFMQLLTDRKIHNYTLPEGWIVVGAINPENEMNDVNTMDSALKDRFEIFNVTYDKKAFLSYMVAKKWNKHIIMFIENNLWSYVLPEEIGNVDGAKYLSPRTWEKLNVAMKAGFHDEEQELLVFNSILGKNIGKTFYNFIYKEYPVLVADLRRNEKEALELLAKYSDEKNYKASYITLTIKSFIEEKVDDIELLSKVLLTIPADQGYSLLKDLSFVLKNDKLSEEVFKVYPKVKKYLKELL